MCVGVLSPESTQNKHSPKTFGNPLTHNSLFHIIYFLPNITVMKRFSDKHTTRTYPQQSPFSLSYNHLACPVIISTFIYSYVYILTHLSLRRKVPHFSLKGNILQEAKLIVRGGASYNHILKI